MSPTTVPPSKRVDLIQFTCSLYTEQNQAKQLLDAEATKEAARSLLGAYDKKGKRCDDKVEIIARHYPSFLSITKDERAVLQAACESDTGIAQLNHLDKLRHMVLLERGPLHEKIREQGHGRFAAIEAWEFVCDWIQTRLQKAIPNADCFEQDFPSRLEAYCHDVGNALTLERRDFSSLPGGPDIVSTEMARLDSEGFGDTLFEELHQTFPRLECLKDPPLIAGMSTLSIPARADLTDDFRGYESAESLLHSEGIPANRLSEGARSGKIKTKRAPAGQKSSQGKAVRTLYNREDALKFCLPKRHNYRSSR